MFQAYKLVIIHSPVTVCDPIKTHRGYDLNIPTSISNPFLFAATLTLIVMRLLSYSHEALIL